MAEESPAQLQEAALPHTPSAATRSGFWLWGMATLLLLGVVTFIVFGQSGGWRRAGNDLQPLGAVPAFTLQERSGRSVTHEELRGYVWLANFIYTRCTTECPLMTHHMARFQEALTAEQDVRLVSITVDPEYDTPEVLTRYAQSFAVQPQRWLFLTGEKAVIHRLAREGFRLGVMDSPEPGRSSALSAPPTWAFRLGDLFTPTPAFAHHPAHNGDGLPQTIIHSGRIVLVDRQGYIRYYYDSTDIAALQHVPRDVRRVLQER